MKTYSAKPARCRRGIGTSSTPATRCSAGSPARSRIACAASTSRSYTPHIDTGDFIVVTNVEKIKVTGNKVDDKLYHRHSGYPGGIRTDDLRQDAAALSGPRAGKGSQGHAAQGSARLRDAQETQVLRRPGASARGAATQDPRTVNQGLLMIGNYYYGTGRRKSAVARVFIKQGSGKFIVNDKPVDEFFTRETGRMVVAPAAEADQPRSHVRHHGQRQRRRRIRPGRAPCATASRAR